MSLLQTIIEVIAVMLFATAYVKVFMLMYEWILNLLVEFFTGA